MKITCQSCCGRIDQEYVLQTHEDFGIIIMFKYLHITINVCDKRVQDKANETLTSQNNVLWSENNTYRNTGVRAISLVYRKQQFIPRAARRIG